jgi:hypothetical protein
MAIPNYYRLSDSFGRSRSRMALVHRPSYDHFTTTAATHQTRKEYGFSFNSEGLLGDEHVFLSVFVHHFWP